MNDFEKVIMRVNCEFPDLFAVIKLEEEYRYIYACKWYEKENREREREIGHLYSSEGGISWGRS